MITVLATNVTMPLWLFLLLFAAGVALNAFLMWCNHDQAATIRRQRRRELRTSVRVEVKGDPKNLGRIPLGELRGGGEL